MSKNKLEIKNPKNAGYVLVTALLITFILTLVTVELLQSGMAESKMSAYFCNNNLAHYSAEIELTKAEEQISAGDQPKNVEMISDRICGVKFYRVTAMNRVGAITHTVQSTYAKLVDTKKCKIKPKVKEGRQSWRG